MKDKILRAIKRLLLVVAILVVILLISYVIYTISAKGVTP